jgi:hypothetical protein
LDPGFSLPSATNLAGTWVDANGTYGSITTFGSDGTVDVLNTSVSGGTTSYSEYKGTFSVSGNTISYSMTSSRSPTSSSDAVTAWASNVFTEYVPALVSGTKLFGGTFYNNSSYVKTASGAHNGLIGTWQSISGSDHGSANWYKYVWNFAADGSFFYSNYSSSSTVFSSSATSGGTGTYTIGAGQIVVSVSGSPSSVYYQIFGDYLVYGGPSSYGATRQ